MSKEDANKSNTAQGTGTKSKTTIVSVPPPSIEKVSIKLPSFWEDSPAAWFAAAEAEFEIAGITKERTRYSYLVSSLPKDVLRKVMDIVTTPHREEPYTNLKAQLLERLSVSEEQRLSQLLYHVEMGDRSPSDFYRHMVHLAGDSENLSVELIRKLWQSRLPKTIEVSLIAIGTRDINELLKVADRLWEVTQAGQVTSFEKNLIQTKTDNPDSAEVLKKEIGELKEMVKKLSVQAAENSRARPRSRTRSDYHNNTRSRTPSYGRQFCWYHHRYGPDARKCVQPCHFSRSQFAMDTDAKQKKLNSSEVPADDQRALICSSPRLFIDDEISRFLFLIDTGADVG